ncbi:MAG: pentapeptide repeat-containing protein [Pseudomonadota bacterium]
MTKPIIKNDSLYQLVRDGRIEEFNQRKKAGEVCDFQSVDLRTVDLRGIDARGLDFSHAYFRQADLRGVDFSCSKLDGASINAAKISGTFFPANIKAEEILLSLNHGTRMRSGTF